MSQGWIQLDEKSKIIHKSLEPTPSDSVSHLKSKSAQACCLFGAKPLPEPMLIINYILETLYFKFMIFH